MKSLLSILASVVALVGMAPCALAADGAPGAAGPTPIADFFRSPQMTAPTVSPNGRLLAVSMANASGRLVLAVADLRHPDHSKVVAAFGDADVVNVHWVNNERLVFGATEAGQPMDARWAGGLFAVNADGSDFKRLIDRRWSTSFVNGCDAGGCGTGTAIVSHVLSARHEFWDTVRDGSADVLVVRYDFSNAQEPQGTTLMRLDTHTGTARSLALGAPPHVYQWLTDLKGNVAAAVTMDKGLERLYAHDSATGVWSLLVESANGYAEPVPTPAAVDPQGRLYVVARQRNASRTTALYRMDVARKQLDAEPLVAVEGYDFTGPVIQDDDTGRVIGVSYETDAQGVAWFDKKLQALQAKVDKALPGTINLLQCRHCTEDGVALITAYSDRESGRFVLYDAKTDRFQSLGAARPWLHAQAMAGVAAARYKTRDGLEIPLYYTAPSGKGPWATVVLVHGGPWVRGGHWQWDPEAQFLASRGYLVVEPEFRGSQGYGAALERAGDKQWGLAMQDDVTDATRWAIDQHLADPKRICIAGASYGGYATLMGLARQPDLYRCGFEWVGVTDINLMYAITWSDTSEDWKRYAMPSLVGDPEKDAAQLAGTSPIRLASKIRQPLLMAYGGSDQRVPIEQGRAFLHEVRKANAHVEWLEYPQEGHGFAGKDSQIDFWGHVESFLHDQLGGTAAKVATSSTP
jgi:dipeptidyl aminopeptidase/acylaminoacyl peptidase